MAPFPQQSGAKRAEAIFPSDLTARANAGQRRAPPPAGSSGSRGNDATNA